MEKKSLRFSTCSGPAMGQPAVARPFPREFTRSRQNGVPTPPSSEGKAESPKYLPEMAYRLSPRYSGQPPFLPLRHGVAAAPPRPGAGSGRTCIAVWLLPLPAGRSTTLRQLLALLPGMNDPIN